MASEPNGNGNARNGVSWASGLINIATSGVLLAVFVIWWSVANPGARLDKIEHDQKDYLSLREHEEFQTRANQIIANIEKRLDDCVTRNEVAIRAQKDDKISDIIQSRIDRLYGLNDDLSRRISGIRDIAATKDQSRLPEKRQ